MTTASDLRTQLRHAILPSHDRMHRHRGLAAAAAGSIAVSNYRLLLARLFGFHRAFEAVVEAAASEIPIRFDVVKLARSVAIESDLRALGLDPGNISKLPICNQIVVPHSEAALLGALYVVEGSALGGIQIARALAPLFKAGSDEGRRFFIGDGSGQRALWLALLDRLEQIAGSRAQEAAAIDSAVTTFLVFESWMDGWDLMPRQSAETAHQPASAQTKSSALGAGFRATNSSQLPQQ